MIAVRFAPGIITGMKGLMHHLAGANDDIRGQDTVQSF
jgi:hypothetical protein